MKHIIFDDPYKKNENYPNEIYDLSNQRQYINNLYHNINFHYKSIIMKHIKTKYSSYKQQDKYKNKLDINKHITLEELIKKIYDSNLKCYYCNEDIYLLYQNKKFNKQWSLERFNNNIGHYNDNTCISCLKCNLQRRNDNHEYFKFGKQLNIKKI
tara:strand:- start:58 stop:522 length:465 start_codon:yes stop_codon:yes gene_type:complete